ncbi:SRPBCC domain-containing protein [Micromonospora sp. NPDC050417]|uniref:SRPBCC domain-containing protein n=1 Tax=Micromonospora sp. NPDC050417 TaxID=3364280 RepID=UPI0037BD4AE7
MQEVIADGEVIEVDPPRRLVQTWRLLMDQSTAKEPFTTLTWEISELPAQPGVCRLTVTHDVTGAPATGAMTGGKHEESGAGGGWAWILSDLKTLVETGSAFSS